MIIFSSLSFFLLLYLKVRSFDLAGYNMRSKLFFKYFWSIFTFGVVGTTITFLGVFTILYYLNQFSLFSVDFDVKEILVFSALITATDTISALTFIDEGKDPKLFSLLFGEGVLNDAMCIVLFQLIQDVDLEEGGFQVENALTVILSFSKLMVFSIMLGIVFGITGTLFLKHMKRFKLNRVQETLTIVFFAFMSYIIGSILGLSPIMSLLICSMTLSHYAFYNLSFQAREESCVVSKVIADIASGFTYAYLGLTFINVTEQSFSLSLSLYTFLAVIFSRYITVFVITLSMKYIH